MHESFRKPLTTGICSSSLYTAASMMHSRKSQLELPYLMGCSVSFLDLHGILGLEQG